jgi:hypothetical protein
MDGQNILFQGMKPETIDILVHNFGHIMMAKQFRYTWNCDMSSQKHIFTPEKHPTTKEKDKDLSMAVIYMAGSAAEEIYHEHYTGSKPSPKAIERMFSDLEQTFPNIIRLLKSDNEPHNYLTFNDLPIKICSQYIYYAQYNLEYIAQANSISAKKLIEKGVNNMIMLSKGEYN